MKPVFQRLVLAAVLSASVAGLGGCAAVVIGGVVAGGLATTDRRTLGTQAEDQAIELKGAGVVREAVGDRSNVSVTSYNRAVLLTGEVPTEADKATVARLVGQVENVRSVLNEVGVMGNSSLTSRSSDTLITARVRAAFVDDKELFANAFKVHTQRGVVYLMGRVTQREANRATEAARGISGVQRVVRAFELISEDDLRRMLPTPGTNQPGIPPNPSGG